MHRLLWIMPLMLVMVTPALAGPFGLTDKSIEERAQALETELAGKQDYHAHLARELAMVAREEKSQHDLPVAKTIMSLAEREAAKSGRP